MSDTIKLVKILVVVGPADWHSVSSETLWATPVGSNLYRLENSPFYAKGFSYLDIVTTESEADTGFPVAKGVVQASGHSTYAIWVINDVKDNVGFAGYWLPLEGLGCTYEGAGNHLLSVDVPASTNVNEAFRLMQAGEDAGVWDFQEQNFAHDATL